MTTEIYPWESPAETNGGMSASLFLIRETTIETADYPNPNTTGRVVVIRIGALTLHVGILGGDEEIVEALDHLLDAATRLREAAVARLDDDDLAERDARIDAGLGTGYVGEFR